MRVDEQHFGEEVQPDDAFGLDIDQDHVGQMLPHFFDHVLRVGRGDDLVPFGFEELPKAVVQVGIAVNNQGGERRIGVRHGRSSGQ